MCLIKSKSLTTFWKMAQVVKCLPAMRETWVQYLGWEEPLEKEIATHSSTLAWKITWMEEPGRLQTMGSQRVGHYWVTLHSFFLSIPGYSCLTAHLKLNKILSQVIIGLQKKKKKASPFLRYMDCLFLKPANLKTTQSTLCSFSKLMLFYSFPLH